MTEEMRFQFLLELKVLTDKTDVTQAGSELFRNEVKFNSCPFDVYTLGSWTHPIDAHNNRGRPATPSTGTQSSI